MTHLWVINFLWKKKWMLILVFLQLIILDVIKCSLCTHFLFHKGKSVIGLGIWIKIILLFSQKGSLVSPTGICLTKGCCDAPGHTQGCEAPLLWGKPFLCLPEVSSDSIALAMGRLSPNRREGSYLSVFKEIKQGVTKSKGSLLYVEVSRKGRTECGHPALETRALNSDRYKQAQKPSLGSITRQIQGASAIWERWVLRPTRFEASGNWIKVSNLLRQRSFHLER